MRVSKQPFRIKTKYNYFKNSLKSLVLLNVSLLRSTFNDILISPISQDPLNEDN